MTIILDVWHAWQDHAQLLAEKDEAVKEAAEYHAQVIELRTKLERLHKESATVQAALNAAATTNLHLEARLAALDPTADNVRRSAWMTWTEKLCDQANAQADLAGRRVIALETWIDRYSDGDRDAIYAEAGLPIVSDPKPEPVAAPTPEEAA